MKRSSAARLSLIVLLGALGAAACDSKKKVSEAEIGQAILADFEIAQRDIAAEFGFTLKSDPPDGWLTTRYLAGASSRPDMPAYCRSYLAFVRDMEENVETLADSIMDVHFRRAGIDPEFSTAFKRGFHRSADDRRALFAAMREYAERALEMHEYLASIDADVIPGLGVDELEFGNLGQQTRAMGLITAVERTGERLNMLIDRQDAAAASAKKKLGANVR